ncbi:hypothetical protein KKH27_05585 [bacterium]|nr:hypothetical protein [bacterium]MBU1985308.1 hypothetical protein [bacterium]
MASTAPTYRFHAHGYPAALDDLRGSVENIEPDLAAGLYALLRSAGVNLHYCEADVLSGRASQFLYSREHPECAQLAFVPPTDTLFRAYRVTWKEVTPSDPASAFSVLREWIAQGRLCLARLKEPLVVYGCVRDRRTDFIVAARLWKRLADSSISVAECDRDFWRYPLDEGNVLLSIESVATTAPDPRELALTAIRRTARSWYARELAGCATGEAAYRQFATDLTRPEVDFTEEPSRGWMGAALWRQWTSRYSLHHYFERTAPRFGGAERQHVTKAAFCYGQCAEAWQRWAAYLGPTWDVTHEGFPSDYPEEFVARWRSHEARMKASRWVEEAWGWEAKAVQELTKTI